MRGLVQSRIARRRVFRAVDRHRTDIHADNGDVMSEDDCLFAGTGFSEADGREDEEEVLE